MRTSELTGSVLDWAVASILGYTSLRRNSHRFNAELIMDPPRIAYGPVDLSDLALSSDWSQGGPIIEREGISTNWMVPSLGLRGGWSAHIPGGDGRMSYGPTPLIAGMRCFVASKLGDEVDVPKELL